MSKTPRSTAARLGLGDDDSATPILHLDMDCFFASVEIREDPSLRGSAVIVGGLGNRGVVTSATYQARASGVRAGQPIREARARCPDAVFLQGRHSLYSEYSRQVMAILSKTTPAVEQVSIDEAFLDVAGATRRLGSPLRIAEGLRARIREELGLPSSVGIASTKSVAKIASGQAKPDGVLLIPADETTHFLHRLPIGALWGVGRRTEEILTSRGIDTVGDLTRTDHTQLRRMVGDASAHHLRELAWGKDPREVGPRAREKSVSTETTFDSDIRERRVLRTFVLQASHQCARRLRAARLVGWTVSIKLRSADFSTITRSRTLTAPTDVGRVIAQAAISLLDKEKLPARGVRLMGVAVSSLLAEDQGIPTLLDEDPKDRETERVMDQAGQRFGPGALVPATLLGEKRASGKPESRLKPRPD